MRRNPRAHQIQKSALAPVLPGANGADLERACEFAVQLGETQFAAFIVEQGLAPLWDARLEAHRAQLGTSDTFRKTLHQARLEATARYLLQYHAMGTIRAALDTAGLEHVVTKGAHTRELYYSTPALRPALDIDILVQAEDRIDAIKVIQKQGYSFHADVKNIAQDCSLLNGNIAIDLHWDILRPGRTRRPMASRLIATKADYGSHWGLSHGATLFLMLVHPVFRKYSTTPAATLVRLVDLACLLEEHPDSINEARPLLEIAGLTTAGWITATWLHLLTGFPAAGELCEAFTPGKIRRKYFLNWLETNRATRLLDSPVWVKLGFTLPAHDRWRDVFRAVQYARRCQREASRTLATMEKCLQPDSETIPQPGSN